MSPKNQEPKEGFTEVEKKVLIGESTFLSVGFVMVLIGAVVYTVSLKGSIDAQAKSSEQIQKEVASIKENYEAQNRIYGQAMIDVNVRLGRIEGKLDSVKVNK